MATKITLNPWPYDGDKSYHDFVDNVYHALSLEFFFEHSKFVVEKHGVFDLWTTKLFDRSRHPLHAAAVIRRAYYLYRVHNQYFN
jgi:hypothetical protein